MRFFSSKFIIFISDTFHRKSNVSQYGMVLNKVWLDLHASDYEGNVMTEYERKFSEKGQVIYRVEAQFKD